MEEKHYDNLAVNCHLYMELKRPSNPRSASVVRSTSGLSAVEFGWYITIFFLNILLSFSG